MQLFLMRLEQIIGINQREKRKRLVVTAYSNIDQANWMNLEI